MVADAGMLCEANLAELEDAGLRFIVGPRIPEVPYQVSRWRTTQRHQPGGPDGRAVCSDIIQKTQERPDLGKLRSGYPFHC